MRVLAMMLAAADDDERSRMLAPLPESVAAAWSQDDAPALARVHRMLADIARLPGFSPAHSRRNLP
jgi:hypothetical protein